MESGKAHGRLCHYSWVSLPGQLTLRRRLKVYAWRFAETKVNVAKLQPPHELGIDLNPSCDSVTSVR